MTKSLSHYRQQLAEKGLSGIVAARWCWYKQAFQMDNWVIGKLVELTGNKVTVQGVTLSVDNPLISTRHKSSLYFGIYEIPERELAQRHIDRTLPVVEIGGSIGGVACTTNRILVNPCAHVVIECNPFILPTLKQNRDSNGCCFAIEPFALAYSGDTIPFNVDVESFMLGRLHTSGGKQVLVQTTTLRRILDKYEFKTINVHSDSEGAEVEMVENEAALFRDHVKCLIIETHEEERGREAIARTLSTLSDLGFYVKERDHSKHVFAMVNRNLS
jgi:FkbM family methyltransferase